MSIEEVSPKSLTESKIKKSETVDVWIRSIVQAFLEVLLMSLPIIIWLTVLQSLGAGSDLTWKSPATCFFALSLWIANARDTQKAFHREGIDSDKFLREILTTYSLIGVVITAVLLALSVANSTDPERYILSFHATLTQIMLYAAAISALAVKIFLIQRKEHKFYC